MTREEFAQKIRAKYQNGITSDGIPYSQLSDDELVNRVVAKYPSYQSQITDNQSAENMGEKPNLVERAKTGVQNFFSSAKQSIQNRGQAGEQELIRASKGEITPAQGYLRTFGQGAGAVADIGKLLVPEWVNKTISKAFEVGYNAQRAITPRPLREAGDKLTAAALTEYDTWKQNNPEAAKDLEAVFNIGEMLLTAEGAVDVANITKSVGKQALKEVEKVGGRTLSTISKVTGDVIEARRLSRISATMDDLDSIIGKTIVQGSTKGKGVSFDAKAVADAKKTLSTINTKGVSSFTDLRTTIDDGVEALANKVDDILTAEAPNIGELKPKDLVTEIKVKNKTVKQNYVEDALNHLEELYTNTNDAASRAEIEILKEKMVNEGLDIKDINDIARRYGREVRSFNEKTGVPLTSINAQAYENTRKGIKKTLRNLMPDDMLKVLDERMSQMMNTSRLVERLEQNTKALYRVAKERGVLENIARKGADIVNAASFNTVSGFVSRFLPSNVGLKTMNAIDLENALSKNLKRINKLLEETGEAALTDDLTALLKSAQKESYRAFKTESSFVVPGYAFDDSGNVIINKGAFSDLADKRIKQLTTGETNIKLKNGNLSEVIKDESLYANTPEIEDIKVEFTKNIDTPAQYNNETKTIYVNTNYSKQEQAQNLIHEVQHSIQYEYGFLPGGTQSDFAGTGLDPMKAYQSLAGEVEARGTVGRMFGIKEDKIPVKDINKIFREKTMDLISVHDQNGGLTYNVFNNKFISNEEAYVVSIFPERSVTIPGKDIPFDTMNRFLVNNSDLLSQTPKVSLGTFYDEANNVTDLDISVVVKSKEEAVRLAQKYNQKSIFDLKNMNEIPTGGTGENLGNYGSVYDRLKEVQNTQVKKK